MASVTCVYGRGAFLSGQRLASEMLIQGLRARGWQVREITTPVLDRGDPVQMRSWAPRLRMAWQLGGAWLRGIRAAFGRDLVYVNVGQTRFALVRDGLPVLIRSLVGPEGRIVLSLHGSFFMAWDHRALESRLLRRMARAAIFVTVLGEAQQQSLVRLGVAKHKVVVMENTCLVAPLTDEQCELKQTLDNGVIRILFLSNLMESKGYPEFIEAIAFLSATSEHRLHATLCGALIDMGPGERFATTQAATEWIHRRSAEINRSPTVRIEWVRGVFGQEKETLLRGAHVFVLPSKVEGQPLVLLEALASGCAVIATKVGAIPETVDPASAILLDEGSPEELAEAILTLAREPNRRRLLARRGLDLFRRRFSYQQHLQRWEALFQMILTGST